MNVMVRGVNSGTDFPFLSSEAACQAGLDNSSETQFQVSGAVAALQAHSHDNSARSERNLSGEAALQAVLGRFYAQIQKKKCPQTWRLCPSPCHSRQCALSPVQLVCLLAS